MNIKKVCLPHLEHLQVVHQLVPRCVNSAQPRCHHPGETVDCDDGKGAEQQLRGRNSGECQSSALSPLWTLKLTLSSETTHSASLRASLHRPAVHRQNKNESHEYRSRVGRGSRGILLTRFPHGLWQQSSTWGHDELTPEQSLR